MIFTTKDPMKNFNYKAWIWLVTIPTAFIVYFYGEALILQQRPTAGTFDWGIFEVPLLVLVFALIFKALTILFVNVTFPSFFRYYLNKVAGGMRSDLSTLPPIQRLCVFLGVFFAFYFSFLYLASLLISGGPSMPLPAVN